MIKVIKHGRYLQWLQGLTIEKCKKTSEPYIPVAWSRRAQICWSRVWKDSNHIEISSSNQWRFASKKKRADSPEMHVIWDNIKRKREYRTEESTIWRAVIVEQFSCFSLKLFSPAVRFSSIKLIHSILLSSIIHGYSYNWLGSAIRLTHKPHAESREI